MASHLPIDVERSTQSYHCPLADDSGNFSNSSNTSGNDEQLTEQPSECDLLRSKEQALFLAMQDLRKLRSELERLSKSEQWYKQELKTQKSTRLDTLERLYSQERKYMAENQRLQQECARLYGKCAELETSLESQYLNITKSEGNSSFILLEEQSIGDSQLDQYKNEDVNDQIPLIKLLRKQKKLLLADIERLSLEHENKTHSLQQMLAAMEMENKRVTTKCARLLDEKQELQSQLQRRENNLLCLAQEKQQMQKIIYDLNETQMIQEKLLAFKEQEFLELKRQFDANLNRETNVDEVHRMSLAYHDEINAKMYEISTLKLSLQELQNELLAMAELESKCALDERTIEQLNFTLKAQNIELEQLKTTDCAKSQKIEDLNVCLQRLRDEKDTLRGCLRETQEKSKLTERELMEVYKQYADMCAVCESKKFELELQEIEKRKLMCQEECDAKEILKLRDSLKKSLSKIEALGKRICDLETKLKAINKEQQMRQQQVRNLEIKLKELSQSNEGQANAAQTCLTKTESASSDTCQNQSPLVKLRAKSSLTNKLIDKSTQTTHPSNCQANEVSAGKTPTPLDKQNTLKLLQKNLSLQDEKVSQLKTFQANWEELLAVINVTQQLEEQMRGQLESKTTELEELNALFALQNEEMHNLQKLAYISECKRDEEFQAIKKTFQAQMQTLENNCKFEISEKEALKLKIVELEKNLETVQESNANKKAEDSLNKFIAPPETATGFSLNQYDAALVAKYMKKDLKLAKSTKRTRNLADVAVLKRRLEHMRTKYEQGQQLIKLLEAALQEERKKCLVADYVNSTSQEEPAHEVANLIDDYKKLVQQSATATGRPRTSAILDLIERSNHLKPNLNSIQCTIDNFRQDIEQLTDLVNTIELSNCYRTSCGDGMPTLMEELRAVAKQLN